MEIDFSDGLIFVALSVFLLLFSRKTEHRRGRTCVCVCVSVCVCLSLAKDFSETIIEIIKKLGTVTASDTRMHHVLIISAATFIEGHKDVNHENNKCSIISESFKQCPSKFAVKVVRLKVYKL